VGKSISLVVVEVLLEIVTAHIIDGMHCTLKCLKQVYSAMQSRSLHPTDAVQGFGISQQAFCRAK